MDESDSDPVVEAYLRDVDVSLLRENLKLTPGERLEKFARFAKFAVQLQTAGEQMRRRERKSAEEIFNAIQRLSESERARLYDFVIQAGTAQPGGTPGQAVSALPASQDKMK